MTKENPLVKAIERITGMARLHGTAFCKVTFNANTDTYNFTPILPQHVIITYEKNSDDKT